MQEVTEMAAGRQDAGQMIEILCLEEDLRTRGMTLKSNCFLGGLKSAFFVVFDIILLLF